MRKILMNTCVLQVVLLFIVQACEVPEETQPVSNQKAILSSSAENNPKPSGIIENQLIVFYKNKKDLSAKELDEKVKQISGIISKNVSDAELVDICRNCNSSGEIVMLFEGTEIDDQADAIASGVRSGGLSGEELFTYSYNYNLIPPTVPDNNITKALLKVKQSEIERSGKEKIVVAVIDNGINQIIDDAFLWRKDEDPGHGGSCYYPAGIQGWNFIGDNPDFINNKTWHGTLVSQYIINQFAGSPENFVQIMSLKSLGVDGKGTLFNSLCAIQFAIQHGANIINASWGFYDFREQPYLNYLLTEVLEEKKVFFFAAAGNINAESDRQAEGIVPAGELRNLDYHPFYPAYLSLKSKNVITVTTVDSKGAVSPWQNYSNNRVDLGVVCDKVNIVDYTLIGGGTEIPFYGFQIPFEDIDIYISGSSFATSIAAGRVGAILPITSYGTPKSIILDEHGPITDKNVHLVNFVKDGLYIEK